jgi:PH and SEC7 domain-containing protein
LLAEHVKYESYVDSLQAAMALRFKRRGEKALERALRTDLAQGSSKGKRKGRAHSKTITGRDKSSPVTVDSLTVPLGNHRRELAQADANEESDA